MKGVADPQKYADFSVSEKQFQKQVENTFRETGWKVYHTLRSKGSTPGFPDIVAIRRGRIVAIELKVGNNKLTQPQYEWLDHFYMAGAEAYTFWPRHWKDITTVADGDKSPRNGMYGKE